ncbi:MAG: ABC transporter permease [Ruminiclostridium sp.]
MENKTVKLKEIFSNYGIIVILLAEFAFFAIINDNFFSYSNIIGVIRQVSFIGISAVGMTMVLMTGGIDLSVGSMLAFGGVISAKLTVEAGLPLVVAIVITMLFGLLFGIINGTLTAKFCVPPLIATLATQTVIKGITFLLTNAYSVKGLSDDYKFFGQGYFGGFFPIPVLFMVLFFAFGWWLLTQTYIGRRIYAVGGNLEAARLSGIKTERITILAYVICSMLTAFAGFMMAGRLGSGQPAVGSGFEMDVITACVLGGISIFGGKGIILNVIFGAIIMGALKNGMIILNISEYWQWITQGIVLAAVVILRNAGSKAQHT